MVTPTEVMYQRLARGNMKNKYTFGIFSIVLGLMALICLADKNIGLALMNIVLEALMLGLTIMMAKREGDD